MIISFRKDGTEARTGLNHLTGDPREELGSAGLASGQWYEQKPPLQLSSPTCLYFRYFCLSRSVPRATNE